MPEKVIPITKVQIGHVIGKGGSTIKSLQEETGAKIEIDNDGPAVKITADDDAQLAAAEAAVKKIIENQENPDYEGPEGARLRKEANELGDKRSKLYDEATAKRNAGDHEAANKLAAEAKQAGEDMEARHREAAAAIAKYNNEDKGKGEDYFDMHGLREEEAMTILKERVAVLESKPADTVTDFEVIPGAGHHSAPGAQKLKGATEEYFKEKGFEYENVSAGSLIVKVPGSGADAGAAAGDIAAADEYPTEDPAAADEYPIEEIVAEGEALAEDEYPTEEPVAEARAAPEVAADEYPTEEPADEDKAARGSTVFVAMPEEVRQRQSRSRGRSREARSGVIKTGTTEEIDAEDTEAGQRGRPSSRVFVRMPAEVRERRSRSREARSSRPSILPARAAPADPKEDEYPTEEAAPAQAENHEPIADKKEDSWRELDTPRAEETEKAGDATPVEADKATGAAEEPISADAEPAAEEPTEADAEPAATEEAAHAEEPAAATRDVDGEEKEEAPQAEKSADDNQDKANDEEKEPSFAELDSTDARRVTEGKAADDDAKKSNTSKKDDKEDNASKGEKEEKKEKKEKDKGGCCSVM